VKILLIVNESPWGSTLALTALHFCRAALESGLGVAAVYFRNDGVYNARPGQVTDRGTPDLAAAWSALGAANGLDLLLCSAAAARRLSAEDLAAAPAPFREAGLVEMLSLLQTTDRVVSF